MNNWTATDVAILAVAAFIALATLVRLMVNRRDALLQDLDEQAQRAAAEKAAEPNE